MAGDFAVESFDDLIRRGVLAIGDGYRAKLEELGGTGPMFLRAGLVSDTHITFDGAERFHQHLASKVESKMSKAGDVVITTKGNSTGRTAYVDEDMPSFVYSPHLSFWRSLRASALVPGYLRYWSKGQEFQNQLRGLSTSTDMAPYLSLVDQRRLKITLPDPDQQRAIAHILGTLDDKIELNRRMNETLEAMSQALFKSWFVDFDPVRAKASGEPSESICNRLRLTPEILALFPDRLVDSELGEIPEGWAVKPLPSVIELNPTRALRKGEVAPYLDMANMPTASARELGVVTRAFSSGMKFMNGDTLVARITPCLENGKTCFVDFLEDGQVGWGSTEYLVFRPIPPLPKEFGYFLARTDTFRSHAIVNMTGTSGRQRVPASAFDDFRLVIPSAAIAQEFGRFARLAIEKTRASDAESQTLGQIRDTLLPKLLSGELRVAIGGVT